MFGSGISSMGCLLDAAEGVGTVQRKGAWYSFGEQRIGQGREKSILFLSSDPALAKYAFLNLMPDLNGSNPAACPVVMMPATRCCWDGINLAASRLHLQQLASNGL